MAVTVSACVVPNMFGDITHIWVSVGIVYELTMQKTALLDRLANQQYRHLILEI